MGCAPSSGSPTETPPTAYPGKSIAASASGLISSITVFGTGRSIACAIALLVDRFRGKGGKKEPEP